MSDCSQAVYDAIGKELEADPVTREPMNALLIWTEIGKGLCGTLNKKGADEGLLGRVIAQFCAAEGSSVEVELARWAYRVEPELRLDAHRLGQLLQRIEQRVVECVAPMHRELGDEGERAVFLAVVRGWFPIGLRLLRALPAARGARPEEVLGALRAWCDRYLPKDPAGPAELGVRMVRE